MAIKTEWVTIKVSDGSEMMVYVARPEGMDAPGMMVIQEAFGVTNHIKDVANRLAEAGYIAAAPEMFHRTAPHGFTGNYEDFSSVMPHTSAVTDETMRADLSATYDWLTHDKQTDSSSIGSIGFCMGGRCTFIANSFLPLKVAVSYYGGNMPKYLELAAKQHAPILFGWGGLDKHITPEIRRSVIDAMIAADKNYVNVEFAKADHGFLCTDRKAYNPEAASEAWPLTMAFLATHFSE